MKLEDASLYTHYLSSNRQTIVNSALPITLLLFPFLEDFEATLNITLFLSQIFWYVSLENTSSYLKQRKNN